MIKCFYCDNMCEEYNGKYSMCDSCDMKIEEDECSFVANCLSGKGIVESEEVPFNKLRHGHNFNRM